ARPYVEPEIQPAQAPAAAEVDLREDGVHARRGLLENRIIIRVDCTQGIVAAIGHGHAHEPVAFEIANLETLDARVDEKARVAFRRDRLAPAAKAALGFVLGEERDALVVANDRTDLDAKERVALRLHAALRARRRERGRI